MKNVSVVIPNYQLQPLKKTLPFILKACPKAEIIIVDDASPDNAVSYFKKNFPKVKVIKNKNNQRFSLCCNLGVKTAKGNIVILLNSDVIPQKNFLKPLLSHFTDKKVFAVSSLEIEKTGGVEKLSGKNTCSFKRGFLVHQAANITSLVKSSDNCWASGGSMAVDKDKYLEIGGMDSLYKPAYWEDIDLSFRAKELGYKIIFEPRSKVYHNHQTTNKSVFGQRQMETIAMRNQFLFVYKNIHGLNLLQHFLWLPYHLVFTTIRTKGVFLHAFTQALTKWVRP